MKHKELLEKYHLLASENSRLTEENHVLRTRLGIREAKSSQNDITKAINGKASRADEANEDPSFPGVNNASDSALKIKLFMSLFKGRNDVYAKRWENKKKATSGYAPVCLNQWRTGLCGKPRISCAKCAHKLYATLDENAVEDHLRLVY